MKSRPILFSAPMVRALLDGSKTQTRRVCKLKTFAASPELGLYPPCPYGQPGDRLWVKETHLYVGPGSGSDLPDYVAEARNPVNHKPENCWYRADGDDATVIWKPSIHMFRGLSRITLEIVSVRVERLQDISEVDATAEGVGGNVTVTPCFAVERYRALWESINGDGSWDANPWVWVIEFRRVQNG